MAAVFVPAVRLPRWVENFEGRHGSARLRTVDASLRGDAADGSWFTASLPFSIPWTGPAELAPFAAASAPPAEWGVLLVRKGGFAVARLSANRLVEHKVGQRHVQGRTKAGGQSQQRFARRRDNQARHAYAAAAEHAVRVLGSVEQVVIGGDRAAVDAVLADVRLAGLRLAGMWHAVPDPRRAVLDQVIRDAQSLTLQVHNADEVVR